MVTKLYVTWNVCNNKLCSLTYKYNSLRYIVVSRCIFIGLKIVRWACLRLGGAAPPTVAKTEFAGGKIPGSRPHGVGPVFRGRAGAGPGPTSGRVGLAPHLLRQLSPPATRDHCWQSYALRGLVRLKFFSLLSEANPLVFRYGMLYLNAVFYCYVDVPTNENVYLHHFVPFIGLQIWLNNPYIKHIINENKL